MKRANNVIHVELAEPYKGEANWYFGSVAAIYQEIPKELIGVSEEHVRRKLRQTDLYITKKGTMIRKSKVITKEQGNYVRSDNR